MYIYILCVHIHIKPLKSEAIHETGLSGNVVTSLFSSHNIYPALLQRIEHCSTRKSTCRLPIYIYRESASRFSHGTVLNMLKQSEINILRGKKDATRFSQQACFVNRFTLQGFNLI